jgi:hypothetical protein
VKLNESAIAKRAQDRANQPLQQPIRNGGRLPGPNGLPPPRDGPPPP